MNLPSQPEQHHTPQERARHYKYFDLVMVGFVTVLLCSNLIGPAKKSQIDLPFTLPFIGAALIILAGNLFFPISYIFGDVLTEVYGYARSRRVIWAGFGALLFATLMTQVILRMPPQNSDGYVKDLQPALEYVFSNGWRIMLASPIAFWCGDFANSYVMAKMKLWTNGRHLWMRTIGSTIVGQGVDSMIFLPIAFLGTWKTTMFEAILTNWTLKVLVEIVFTPLTYVVVNFLKRAEKEDFYDTDTNFTPFSLKD